MKQIRVILIFALLFLGMLNSVARESVLVVSQTNGTRTAFVLSDKPELTFNGKDCVFSCKEQKLVVSLSEVANLSFEESAARVENVRQDETQFEFVGKDVIMIKGNGQDTVRLYDIHGRSIKADVKSVGDIKTVSLESLPKGTYIIKYADNFIKIIRQ